MNILFADDHKLIRDGIRPFLEELAPKINIFEGESFSDAYEIVSGADRTDLVILDLLMPGMNGLQGVIAFATDFPSIPVVILSGHFNKEDVLAAIQAGASGYIPKTLGGESMINALRLVLGGEIYLPANVFSGASSDTTLETRPAPRSGRSLGMTPRETEVIEALVNGKTNKQIARELAVEEVTIKVHLKKIYRKIGAVNRADAVRVILQS